MIKITYKQYGGKSTLAKWIVSNFPEHGLYLEPFCGSCSVLFAKPKSHIEIVNDLDNRIINMFNQIRERPAELAALLWATPYAKANWRDGHSSEDKLEDARLIMAQGCQFYCGNGNTSTWAIDKCTANHKPKPNVWSDWFLRILPAALRIKDVQILNEDGLVSIQRVYKNSDALIYADPVYYGHEKEYRFATNYKEMVNLLKEATCKVIVSEYDTALDFWHGWRRIEKVTAGRARTGAHNTVAKTKVEVLFMNY